MLDFIRGNTFILRVTFTSAGLPVALSGYAVSSQIRTELGGLVSNLDVSILDEIGGVISLTAPAALTAEWPDIKLLTDVAIVANDGSTISTRAVTINVIRGVTDVR